MNTPKQSFLVSKEREALEKWVTTREAETARDYALLEFVNRQPKRTTVQESWDEQAKLIGAREVLEILFELPFKEKEQRFDRLPNLPPPK